MQLDNNLNQNNLNDSSKYKCYQQNEWGNLLINGSPESVASLLCNGIPRLPLATVVAEFVPASMFGEGELIKFNSRGAITGEQRSQRVQRDLIVALKIYSYG